MPGEPILSKHQDDPEHDHKPMTWERFLQLRTWAKWIAWHEQCTVALVGSVLENTTPRDIDIALIWPDANFAEMFGSTKYLQHKPAYRDKHHALYVSGQELVHRETRIDVRLCPECWWPEKERLILAVPTDIEPPNSWNGVEFIVYKVVREGSQRFLC